LRRRAVRAITPHGGKTVDRPAPCAIARCIARVRNDAIEHDNALSA